MKKALSLSLIIPTLFFASCSSGNPTSSTSQEIKHNTIYYQGHASVKFITREGKIIYVDPYAGDGYEDYADLILITHSHYDHNDISKIKNRNEDCRIITNEESLINGQYQSFDLDYVKVKTVEAYNSHHDKNKCVGYIITFSDEIKVYIPGDTSITSQMDEMSEWNIDYAFIPCDGTYTMNIEEVKLAITKIKPRFAIPYHTITNGDLFSDEVANQLNIENKLIIHPKEYFQL